MASTHNEKIGRKILLLKRSSDNLIIISTQRKYQKVQAQKCFFYDNRMRKHCAISMVFVQNKLCDQDHAYSQMKEYTTLHHFRSCILWYENLPNFSNLLVFNLRLAWKNEKGDHLSDIFIVCLRHSLQ